MQHQIARTLVIVVAFVAATLLSVAPTDACSRGPLERVPTHFELVAMADAIVIATPISDPDTKNNVRFEVVETLKGSAQGQKFAVTSRPPPKQLPGGGLVISSCPSETYPKGSRYVAFLSKDATGAYDLVASSWSPTITLIDAEASNWIRIIKTFVDIQSKYAPLEQLDVLDRLLIEKLNGPDTPENFYDATEIHDHLAARTMRKPTAFLLRIYEMLERSETPKYGSGATPSELKTPSSRAMMARVLENYRPPVPAAVVGDEKNLILQSLVLGDHPTAAPLFERLSGVPNPSASILAHAISFFAKNKQPRRAFDLMETKAVRALAALPDNSWDLAEAIAAAGSQLPWRSDPYLKATWPDLALQFYWIQVEIVGNSAPWLDEEAVEFLLAGKYRDLPQATLALAKEENKQALDWAVAELSVPAPPQTPFERELPWTDPAYLPMQALVAPLRTRFDVIDKVACQSADRRRLLIIAIGDAGSEARAHTLAKLAVTSSLSADERVAVAQAAAEIYARSSSASPSSDNENYKLLTQIIRREPIVYMERRVEPLRCPR